MTQEPVVLINTFTVLPDSIDEAIAAWEVARDFLSTQPGYISTELHRALATDATYALINVAKWESPQAFMDATRAMGREAVMPVVDGVHAAPRLYRVIRR